MRTVSADEFRKSIQMAVQYVHSCQMEDGGYFFAKIPPSSLQDTLFAIEILRMVEQRPRCIEGIEQFILSFQNDFAARNLHALYLASGALLALGKPIEALRGFVKAAFERFNVSGIECFDSLDMEVVSELKSLFEAVCLFLRFAMPVDSNSVTGCILSLANKDGGFGYRAYSTLATTYYAVQTLALLKRFPESPGLTLDFLKKKEPGIYFLEDLYYLMQTRSLLGENPWPKGQDKAAAFILGYQRASGGFARARPMGIPTLEYTWYAMSLLKLLKKLPTVRER